MMRCMGTYDQLRNQKIYTTHVMLTPGHVFIANQAELAILFIQ